ncbi:hypothetical protein ES703_09047 [subsurface metagenome]
MVRYFIRGLIDGSLSTLGIVIGASIAIGLSPEAARIIVAAGIGGGIANGLSNIIGAFAAEKTVAEKRILLSSVIDGLATIGGSVIPVLPFFILPALPALEWSIAVTLALFFSIGIYIGRVSRENLALSGFKMVLFAAATAGIAALIKIVM